MVPVVPVKTAILLEDGSRRSRYFSHLLDWRIAGVNCPVLFHTGLCLAFVQVLYFFIGIDARYKGGIVVHLKLPYDFLRVPWLDESSLYLHKKVPSE